ncbi:MAG TPA: Rne/Rng family ribonuclease [Nocardioidaceae bacterium]|nr:Rne/Rng family ribonuclease [Nocardioidaceae bacterium]
MPSAAASPSWDDAPNPAASPAEGDGSFAAAGLSDDVPHPDSGVARDDIPGGSTLDDVTAVAPAVEGDSTSAEASNAEPAELAQQPDDTGTRSPRRSTSRRRRGGAASSSAGEQTAPELVDPAPESTDSSAPTAPAGDGGVALVDSTTSAVSQPVSPVPLLFQAPDPVAVTTRTRGVDTDPHADADADGSSGRSTSAVVAEDSPEDAGAAVDTEAEPSTGRARRSRGGRGRRKPPVEADTTGTDTAATTPRVDDATAEVVTESPADDSEDSRPEEESSSSRRRRRRRRSGEEPSDAAGADDKAPTVVRVRQPRAKKESVSSVEGSTRIEAKKQRRREGRDAGRRRPPILSESEFLARRESVDRVMAIRQRGDVTQIAVLEDDILVEHYVALQSQSSLIGNVYLGRVQNVLPSMEAAFIDIGKGRNAVLYAGEVDWDVLGGTNQARRIENALKPGQTVLVQVSKDPVGHKGARLTSQISLPGRYLVYVPGGGTSGISRKLPDTERSRLKSLLKDIVPDSAGVIIRTAAEGASEEELTRDVTRLTARWEDIEKKVKAGQAPALLYGEPDTTIKVVRDLFTEDFAKLVISGDDAWDMVDGYVQHVAPDLAERLERFEGDGDVFAELRVEEQIAKALERKVWLPSGGSLVIDRTEAMTVVDVNTGKFTGSGGNLEETVTKNNLEAAEEIVRQLRLRDIGGIIVIDFIDMVLEHNRDLVLRRVVECLGRDRTRHQVAEVTSLGLVQMTRKRIGTGLIEAFSQPCSVCSGRGVVIEQEPVEEKRFEESHSHASGSSGSSRGSKRSSNRRRGGSGSNDAPAAAAPTGSDNAAPGAGAKSSSAQPAEGGSAAGANRADGMPSPNQAGAESVTAPA